MRTMSFYKPILFSIYSFCFSVALLWLLPFYGYAQGKKEILPYLSQGEAPITSLYLDALALVFVALNTLAQFRNELLVSIIIAFVFSAIWWVIASHYSSLWNLRFKIKPIHHVLCFFAALCAFGFTLVFISIKYTEQAAIITISMWRTELISDQGWSQATFRTAYREVKALGLEDFTDYPAPDQGGHLIPLNHLESRTKSAEVYAHSAIKNFQLNHPFLSRILNVRSSIPSTVVDQDVNDFFRVKLGSVYPVERAVDIATTEIKGSLQAQAARVVLYARILLVFLFLLIQIIPFGIIGYAAYKDLRIRS